MARAQDIMTTDPACVTPDTLLADAARIMKDHNVGMLPVVERAGSNKLVGVVTDRDITIRHTAEGHGTGCPVREAMSSTITTARADDDVDQVMTLMGKEQVRRIPIVDERGGLVGVVAQADIALEADEGDAGETVQKISQPSSTHAQ